MNSAKKQSNIISVRLRSTVSNSVATEATKISVTIPEARDINTPPTISEYVRTYSAILRNTNNIEEHTEDIAGFRAHNRDPFSRIHSLKIGNEGAKMWYEIRDRFVYIRKTAGKFRKEYQKAIRLLYDPFTSKDDNTTEDKPMRDILAEMWRAE